MKSHQVPRASTLSSAFPFRWGLKQKYPNMTTCTLHTLTKVLVRTFTQKTTRPHGRSVAALWLVSLFVKHLGWIRNTSGTDVIKDINKYQINKCCGTWILVDVTFGAMHKLFPNHKTAQGDTWMRRGRMEKELLLYLRQGGARFLTGAATRKGGWGGMGGGQHRCGWLIGCGWNEQRKVGERQGGVRGTNRDNKEKPGHT